MPPTREYLFAHDGKVFGKLKRLHMRPEDFALWKNFLKNQVNGRIKLSRYEKSSDFCTGNFEVIFLIFKYFGLKEKISQEQFIVLL